MAMTASAGGQRRLDRSCGTAVFRLNHRRVPGLIRWRTCLAADVALEELCRAMEKPVSHQLFDVGELLCRITLSVAGTAACTGSEQG